MKIKEEFFNEKSLKPYGFKKEVIDAKWNICEYTREDEYATTLIQRCSGDISIVIPNDYDCDCTDVPDVVYHLIKDGLVEADPLKDKRYQLDELSETACKNALKNMAQLIIKKTSEYYGIKGHDMLALAYQMHLRFDENGNIEE